eukprot:TRINITY_DN15782_c0_g3_i6.p1 TRINITY_DN15782_c0_g3~~TRINITY_DN15782_c0_g3_i6.p1  ORF type:complete len:670 (-),score=100.73 TRINITY_DN15782_c0_g3_i6:190-2199(-)
MADHHDHDHGSDPHGGEGDLPAEAYAVYMFIALGIACVLLYVVIYCRSLPQRLNSCALSAWGLWAEFKLWLHDWWSPLEKEARSEAAALRYTIRRLAEDERVQRGKLLMDTGVHVMAIVTLYNFVHLWRSFGSHFAAAPFKDLIHHGHLVSSILTFAYCLYIQIFADSLTAMKFDVIHGLLIGRIFWECVTSDDAGHLLAEEVIHIAVRMALAVLVGRPTLTLCLNVAAGLAKYVTYTRLLAGLSPLAAETITSIAGSPSHVLLNDAHVWVAAWTVSMAVQAWDTATVRSRLAASVGAQNTKALASIMCNAVVNVDENLELADASLQFADFLLRRPPNNTYKGVSLLQFVVEEERQHTRQQIRTTSSTSGTPLSITTKLVDGNGSHLDVRMYCIASVEEDGGIKYVIGLSEVVADPALARVSEQVAEAPESADGLGVLRGFATPQAAFDEESETSSISASSMASTVAPMGTADAAALEAWVDMSHALLPVTQTNAAMSHIIGPSESDRSTLSDWAPDMAAYLVEAFETYMRGPKDAGTEVSLGKVQLAPTLPQPVGMRVRYNASATADFSKVREAYETDRRHLVHLRFRNLEMKLVYEGLAEGRAAGSSTMTLSSKDALSAPAATQGITSSSMTPEPPELAARVIGTATNSSAPVSRKLPQSIAIEVVL